MSEKIEELESKIGSLLPKRPTLKVDPAIQELTRELINEGENAGRTRSYTHSVCHLFEKFGWRDSYSSSYLNSTAQLPVVEELVDYTLRKALKAGDLGCVGRIVLPIMNLNLAHLEEDLEGFIFRPKILTDPDFIQGFSSSLETEYYPYLVDFCKSENMGEFFPKYTEALRKEKKLEPIAESNEVVLGIFVDVNDTLIEYVKYDSEKQRPIYKRIELTQEYALRKMEEGIPVTVFTGGRPEDVKGEGKGLESVGIDKRLCNVKFKGEFIGRILETCVSYTAPAIQGFRAKTHYESGKKAWETEYPTKE